MKIQEHLLVTFAEKVGAEKYGALGDDVKTQFEKLAKDIGYLHLERQRRVFNLEEELRHTTAQYLNLEVEGLAELKELFNDSLQETLDFFAGPLIKAVKGIFKLP